MIETAKANPIENKDIVVMIVDQFILQYFE